MAAGMFDLIVRRVAIDGRDGSHDIAIAGERIAAIAPRLDAEAEVELDGEDRLASPAFVQPHIHLDKALVGRRLPPNSSGTLAEAISLLHESKRAATVEEIRERAGIVIRQAVIAGTTTLRSHVDVDTIGGLRPLEGVAAARADHADLCDIQIVAFPQEGIWRNPGTDELLIRAMRSGADLVGGMPHWESDHDAARRHIAFCLDLAVRHDADVDMHVDETDDGRWHTFELLIDEAERRGWGARTSAGHVCAMAAWEDGFATAVIRRAATAGVKVITNPPTNLMLQGRGDAEPRRRGIPRIKELLAAGVTVAAGQDCVEDAFYPFGTADPLQVALIVAHAAQLGTPSEIAAALRMVGEDAARVLRLPVYGLVPGARADLVVLDAAKPQEALREQAPRRWVVCRGRIVAETIREQRLHRSTSGHEASGGHCPPSPPAAAAAQA
ncbi:MAG: amidohydrolase family protein [Solirubrobacterales bacterium]|nr:amidohydrolase family protein [Solirubrobacterales bacterium]MBV9715021.1 amidohydrolase family protein [Solirubrobacterales bacterium]